MTASSIGSIFIPGSVLFLGSGFSRSALNIRNQKLPTERELKEILAAEVDANPDEHSLRTIADEVASRPELDLHQILYELFTVRHLQEYQKKLLSLPWLRIYTTNYDDAVEFAYQQTKNSAPSFNYDDPKPKRLPQSSVVHLHGVIRRANDQNVLEQLVLNESSYVRQHFEKSPWYDEFERDLRYGSACYFVGYSLSDYHISALLMQNPVVRARTFFVTLPPPVDKIFANRVESYGAILPVGAEAFADHCVTQPAPEITLNPHATKSFKYLDPFKDKRTLTPPTSLEVLNLMTFGTFNYQRCLSTLPNAEYVVPRQTLANQGAELLKQSTCLLVHSRMGNGKSIFLHILAHKLAEEQYHCFWCKPNALALAEDIEILKAFDRLAIFFDSYDTAIDLIEHLRDLPRDTKFIVAVRSGVQEVRLHEIQERLPRPLHRLSLNGITKEDQDAFTSLLDRSGIRTATLEQDIARCREFREVVVKLYDNAAIKEKVRSELKPLLADAAFRRVFVTSHLLGWIGRDAGPAFLRSVTQQDAYAVIGRFREIAGDVIRLDDDEIQVRSPIFSEYLIEHHFTTSDILDSVFAIVVEAVKRKKERRYQPILSSLMQISTLKRALHNDPEHLKAIAGVFDRLHRDIDVNREPLFWLQYSILMVDVGDLVQAEAFLETAYDRATASPGFLTYQLDTQALRVLMLAEQRETSSVNVRRFERIIDKMQLVLSMIGNDSHRDYAIRVFEGVEPFVQARLNGFSTDELNVLMFQLHRVDDALGQLSPELRAQTGADPVRTSLERARRLILAR